MCLQSLALPVKLKSGHTLSLGIYSCVYVHLALCVTLNCTAAMLHHIAFIHTHVQLFCYTYTLIMAARPGTNQRTNGIPREKICQFKLVLLGKPHYYYVLIIRVSDSRRVVCMFRVKTQNSIDVTPSVVRNSNHFSFNLFIPSLDLVN